MGGIGLENDVFWDISPELRTCSAIVSTCSGPSQRIQRHRVQDARTSRARFGAPMKAIVGKSTPSCAFRRI